MRGLDLFAGIAGASIAMLKAGIEVVAHAEIEPFCCRVLECRLPGIPNLGDVSRITAEQVRALGPIDVVSFGSPCQDWSVAGKRLGLKGHRSSLFHEAVRIVRVAKPRWAVFENVPGILSAAGGWDFAAVLDEMADAGALDIAWRVLDAQWFGVPQRRRRIFLVADFGGERAGQILSLSEGVQRHPAPGREAGEEAARGARGGAKESVLFACQGSNVGEFGTLKAGNGGLTGGVPFMPEVSHALTAHPSGQRNDPTEQTFITHALTSEGHDASEDGTERGTPLVPTPILEAGARQGTKADKRDGLGIGEPGDPMFMLQAGKQHALAFAENQRSELRVSSVHPQLTTGGGKPGQGYPAVAQPMAVTSKGNGEAWESDVHTSLSAAGGGQAGQGYPAIRHGMAVRRLTPRECERLQGFPDDWTNISGASDSGRYRALGNAWAIPCGEWVMRRMAGAI